MITRTNDFDRDASRKRGDQWKDNVTVSIETITPEKAIKLLEKNYGNRPISRVAVDNYANLMRKGEWRLVDQGIWIGRNGRLINGQHRLLACVKSKITIQVLVLRDETIDNIIDLPIDQGTKRSMTWVLKLNPRSLPIVNQLAELSLIDRNPTSVSQARELFSCIEEEIAWFIKNSTGTKTRYLASSPVQAGAVYCGRIFRSYRDDIITMYNNIVNQKFIEFTEIMQSVYKNINEDSRSRENRTWKVLISIFLFSPENAKRKRVYKKEILATKEKIVENIREIFENS